MKNNSIINNILLSILTSIIFLAIVEFVFRTTHIFGAKVSNSRPDKLVGWTNIPNSRSWHFKENDHPILLEYNNYGWRDRKWSLKKAKNTYRVAVLGDSYVEAKQVEASFTFGAIAETKLNDMGYQVEFMRFGRSGFTQTEELLVLKNQITPFNPDIVLLFFLPKNDIGDVRKETAGNKLRPFYKILDDGELFLDTSFISSKSFKFRVYIQHIKNRSALISLICERWNAYHLNIVKKKKERQRKGLYGVMSLCTNNPNEEYIKSYNLNKYLIKEMVKYCKKNDIQFVLVTLDTSAHLPENEIKYKSVNASFNANFFED